MSEDYDQINEAEQLNNRKEEYLEDALEASKSYEGPVERYEGTVSSSLDGQELERGEDAVDAMLRNWKNTCQ